MSQPTRLPSADPVTRTLAFFLLQSQVFSDDEHDLSSRLGLSGHSLEFQTRRTPSLDADANVDETSGDQCELLTSALAFFGHKVDSSTPLLASHSLVVVSLDDVRTVLFSLLIKLHSMLLISFWWALITRTGLGDGSKSDSGSSTGRYEFKSQTWMKPSPDADHRMWSATLDQVTSSSRS